MRQFCGQRSNNSILGLFQRTVKVASGGKLQSSIFSPLQNAYRYCTMKMTLLTLVYYTGTMEYQFIYVRYDTKVMKSECNEKCLLLPSFFDRIPLSLPKSSLYSSGYSSDFCLTGWRTYTTRTRPEDGVRDSGINRSSAVDNNQIDVLNYCKLRWYFEIEAIIVDSLFPV